MTMTRSKSILGIDAKLSSWKEITMKWNTIIIVVGGLCGNRTLALSWETLGLLAGSNYRINIYVKSVVTFIIVQFHFQIAQDIQFVWIPAFTHTVSFSSYHNGNWRGFNVNLMLCLCYKFHWVPLPVPKSFCRSIIVNGLP